MNNLWHSSQGRHKNRCLCWMCWTYHLSKPPQTTETDEGPLAVTQYHFTSWPDHGVPQFTTSLVSFVRRVQKAHNKDGGAPLLVHCSAGVGQTGTFILLDSMLEKMREENSLNVYECLVNLRKRRVLMVQTLVGTAYINHTLISFSYPFVHKNK